MEAVWFNLIVSRAVDDAVDLADDLADVLAPGFGHGAAYVWKLRQVADALEKPLDKLPGIEGRILRDVSAQLPDIGARLARLIQPHGQVPSSSRFTSS